MNIAPYVMQQICVLGTVFFSNGRS